MSRTQITPAQLSNEWYQELGRTTLGTSGNTLAVSSFTAKKNLRVIIRLIGSGTVNTNLTVNSDTGANYAYRTLNSGSAASSASQSNIALTAGDINNAYLFVIDIFNNTANEKFMHGSVIGAPSGAANAPFQVLFEAKWANTAAQINTISLNQTNTGSFASGSEMIVLGHD